MSVNDGPPSHLYWMRAVSFAGLHRLLTAVAAAPRGLRARDVNALVLEGHVTLTPRTPRPKPSTLYHYRNTLVRLGALVRDGVWLRPNRDDSEVAGLLAEAAPANGDHLASHAARERFAALVLKNKECRTLFFDLFFPARGSRRNVSDFRRLGAPVSWTRRPRPDAPAIVFQNQATGREATHASRAAVTAVLYGLRYWARDELALIDEYSERTLNRTTLFPIAAPPVGPADRDAAIQHAVQFLLSLRAPHADREWTMLSVSELIVDYCQNGRQPRSVLFGAFDWLRRRWPGHTMLVPTPLGLATLAARSAQEQGLALRRYYKPANGPYVSHIRLHHDVTAGAEDARRRHA